MPLIPSDVVAHCFAQIQLTCKLVQQLPDVHPERVKAAAAMRKIVDKIVADLNIQDEAAAAEQEIQDRVAKFAQDQRQADEELHKWLDDAPPK